MESIIGFSLLSLMLIYLVIQNYILRRRIRMVECSQTQYQFQFKQQIDNVKAETELLTKDQEAWLKKNKEEIQRKIKTISEDLKKENQKLNSDQEQWVKNNRSEFDKRLSDELNKACEKIKFNEIEYKKTITKKRKEYNRKNSANAKPQRQHRYIDEDNSPSMQ